MTFWVLNSKREELLTVFEPMTTNTLPIKPVKTRNEDAAFADLARGNVALVWMSNPTRLDKPPLIVVPHGELPDFLAWTSTFLKHIRPLTAFSRVIDNKDWEAMMIEEFSRSSASTDGLESALSGLVIAEALGGSSTNANPRDLSIFSCGSTFFFALSRALSVKLPEERLRRLHGDWVSLRAITRQSQKDIRPETVESIQEVLMALTDNSSAPSSRNKSPIVMACQELRDSGEISSQSWVSLVEGHSDLSSAQVEMRASRERRVGFLDRVLRNDTAPTEPTRLFALGYLLSLFDNGASINMHFLPATPTWTSVLLWHGFTAGLQKGNTIESIAGGLGRRVSRDIFQQEDLISHPRADINLDELTMLNDVKYPIEELSTEYPNVLTVEVAPRVRSVVRWPVRSRDTHQATNSAGHEHWKTQQRSLFHESDDNERTRLLAELGSALDRARSIQQRLSTMDIETDSSRKKSERRKKY